MSGQKDKINLKYFIIITGCLLTFLLSFSVYADEDVADGGDRFASIKHEKDLSTQKTAKKEIPEIVSINKYEISGSDDNYEPIDIELLTFSPPKYSFSLDSTGDNYLNLPGSVIDFGSGVYIGSPIFTLDKERLYKGAGEEDLESTFGAAVKIVILNR